MLLLPLLLACTNTRTSDGPESGGTSPDSRASDTSALESVPSLPADTEEDADDADGCPPVYDQHELPAFDLQISDAEWSALQADYSYGTKAWHPAVFTGTLNGETVTMADAAVRLSGNPGFSWIGPKMQFAISFTQTDLERAQVLSRGGNISEQVTDQRRQASQTIAGGEVAAARVYAGAYNANPGLYTTLRSLDTASKVMGPNTTVILRTDSAPFKVLSDGPSGAAPR